MKIIRVPEDLERMKKAEILFVVVAKNIYHIQLSTPILKQNMRDISPKEHKKQVSLQLINETNKNWKKKLEGKFKAWSK